MSVLGKPAVWLVENLASRQLGVVELMRETLARIDAVNGKVNAVVSLRDPEVLLAEAEAGQRTGLPGPLYGLPIAIKDLSDVANVATTRGSRVLEGNVPDRDDLMVSRLRAAGAVIVGKTNVPEFGLGSHSVNPLFGTTRNPYDLSRSAGGSSGGAAVALATGMVALADGSDMMGSLRNPAAWNNVYGFRPTWGLVPSDPIGDVFMHQLATLGPMARTPQDLALMLDIISGPDPRAPLARPSEQFFPLPEKTLSGLRIGWLGDWDGAFPMEAGVIAKCQEGLRELEGLGCVVEPVPAPFAAEEMWDAWVVLRQFDTLGRLGRYLKYNHLLGENALWELDRAQKLSGAEILAANTTRSDWYRTCIGLFDRFDALAMPATQMWPFPVDWAYPKEISGVQMDTYHRWMQVVVPVSLIGMPSLALPAGFGDSGLPMGFQIFGPRGSDRMLLSLGAAYHEATQWPQRRPPPDPD